jgi:hypothetical protein
MDTDRLWQILWIDNIGKHIADIKVYWYETFWVGKCRTFVPAHRLACWHWLASTDKYVWPGTCDPGAYRAAGCSWGGNAQRSQLTSDPNFRSETYTMENEGIWHLLCLYSQPHVVCPWPLRKPQESVWAPYSAVRNRRAADPQFLHMTIEMKTGGNRKHWKCIYLGFWGP